MAKLKAPIKAYRYPKGKWHLPVPFDPRHSACVSACGYLLWADQVETSSVRKLKADDICKKCLGPLLATD